MENQKVVIDTGDHVKHGPTGETWTVAFVRDEKHLYYVGWPPGYAQLSDCELVKKATAEEKQKTLKMLAASSSSDERVHYARQELRRQLDG